MRIGNWVTIDQSRILLQKSSLDTLRGKRDRAILDPARVRACDAPNSSRAAGCRSRQIRDDHWVIADLMGKGKRIRTVPMPVWVKAAIDEWLAKAHITGGQIFRRINKNGSVWGAGITPKAIWHVVKSAARQAGIKDLAPART